MNSAASALDRVRLTEYLARVRSAKAASQTTIPHVVSESPAPLSVSQEDIWRLSQESGLPPLFNESVTIHRHGQLQVSVLEKALGEIVRRHEAWRATFEVLDGKPVQVVWPPTPVVLPLLDLRDLPESERNGEAIRAATENAQRPFDLAAGSLMRTTLVRLDDNEYRLFLTLHMIVLDGVSIYQVLLPELKTLCVAFAAGKPSPLPELPIQVSDFARWQRQWLHGAVSDEQIKYWRRQLDAQPPPLPWPAGPRPAKQSFRGAIESFTASGDTTHQLNWLSRSEGVTIFTVLTAVLTSLLSAYTKQTDVTVGAFSPSGRKRSEVKNLLGYFLNPVPLRVSVHPEHTFSELLKQVATVNAAALSNDDVSFGQLVDELRPKPDPSRNPFFQVALSHHPPLPQLGPGWDISPMDVNSGGARWDLYLAFDVRCERILVRAQYNPDLFDRKAMGYVVRDFEILLQAAAAAPDKTVSDLIAGCSLLGHAA